MSILWVLPCLVLLSRAYGLGIPVIRPLIFGYVRLVNGAKTASCSGPRQVSIQISPRSHFCGVSLIKNQWVITTAHCGFRHPEYNIRTTPDDIALIQLSSPLTINEDVSLVSPDSGSDTTNKGDNCVTTKSGYATDSSGPWCRSCVREERNQDPGRYCVLFLLYI
ncbi:chymotrypsinogen 2-like [Aquarana catesbeiana]|uniref:chymotrypsinogen 2-like n=1 Tax=Aquarana catesbeiana TaxID=8400 RepID=UPI003CCA4EED